MLKDTCATAMRQLSEFWDEFWKPSHTNTVACARQVSGLWKHEVITVTCVKQRSDNWKPSHFNQPS